jgi:hypothetical protein
MLHRFLQRPPAASRAVRAREWHACHPVAPRFADASRTLVRAAKLVSGAAGISGLSSRADIEQCLEYGIRALTNLI